MNKTEEVKIELKANANPPVKCCKARNGRPSANNFTFKPRTFPHLSEFVNWLHWDSVKKTLTLSISETPLCEVYRWLQYVQELNQEIQKSPFVDPLANCAVLVLKDACGTDVAEVRFKNLNLVEHACDLSKRSDDNFGIDNTAETLSHVVSLSYQYAEFVHSKDTKQADWAEKLKEDVADEEWQTVETP